ncbi:hypothetical protein RUND412_003681 [Rhizina undulata]
MATSKAKFTIDSSFTPRPKKRTRTSPPEIFIPSSSSEESESTDFKLALLTSLYPTLDSETLLEILLSAQGDVQLASSLLSASDPKHAGTPGGRKENDAPAALQISLSGFISGSSSLPKPPKKGTTLRLYSAPEIAALTPTTFHPSFLPPALANELLRELVEESKEFSPPIQFQLFDRLVVSPHTSCFYIISQEIFDSHKAEYYYQGAAVPQTRFFTLAMKSARDYVEEIVNAEISKRERRKGQMSRRWKVDFAMVNCYDGGKESVGWHTDQLTYLGPMTTIANVSLGVAREFRVRKVSGDEEDEKEKEEGRNEMRKKEEGTRNGEGAGAIGIWLPHNSLLIMHAGMQEEWKHCLQPAASIDRHPISGNKRINITYRCYREGLKPRFTPKCDCDHPTVLRCVMKRSNENFGKYFWGCHRGSVVGETGCAFFQWAKFDDEGEPLWADDGFKKDEGKEARAKGKYGDDGGNDLEDLETEARKT